MSLAIILKINKQAVTGFNKKREKTDE